MYKINDHEIDFILDDITKKGIVTEDVKYNILDHVCCIIENEMTVEMDFYECYRNTIAQFYQTDLHEIEQETQVLLTFKNYRAMKRTLKISGGLSAVFILVGIFLKTQHLPGAGIILFLGLVVFSLLFVPLNILLKYQDDKNGSNKIIMTLGLSTVSIITIGVLFKIMHWPSANIMLQSGLAIFTLVFVPIYFFTRFKDPNTKFNAIVHSTFMVAGAGMLYALLYTGPSYEYLKQHDNSPRVEVKTDQTTIKLQSDTYYELV